MHERGCDSPPRTLISLNTCTGNLLKLSSPHSLPLSSSSGVSQKQHTHRTGLSDTPAVRRVAIIAGWRKTISKIGVQHSVISYRLWAFHSKIDFNESTSRGPHLFCHNFYVTIWQLASKNLLTGLMSPTWQESQYFSIKSYSLKF